MAGTMTPAGVTALLTLWPAAFSGMVGGMAEPRSLPIPPAEASAPPNPLGTVVYEDVWLPSERGMAS
jgi:hypothetical protein